MWVFPKIFGKAKWLLRCSKIVSRKWGFFWQVWWLINAWKCLQEVCVFWLLLVTWRADEPAENVSRMWVWDGFCWQLGLLMEFFLKMYSESEHVLASSGKLDGSWGSFWKCVQAVSVFWLLLVSWLMKLLLKMCPACECVLSSSGKMADKTPSENLSSLWVCSGYFWQAASGWLMRLLLTMCPGSECVLASSDKLDGSWGSFWKCVQEVSLFWLLLVTCMAHEAPSENVSRQWVSSGFFWQTGWFIRLLLKMCPGSGCVLASSDKLNCSWGCIWKCVQEVSVFWLLLASSGKLDGSWGSF